MKQRSKRIVASSILVMFVASSFIVLYKIPSANADDANPILTDAINSVLSGIQTTDSPWSVIYSQVFGLQNQSVFDDAILQALNASDYLDVIFIARLAEINGYSSTIINDSVITALQNMPMCGSLPTTSDNQLSFSVYDRYMVNAYHYAQELNVSGWDINQAFLDFTSAYLQPPKNSQSGEMLWINPQTDYSASFNSRYYDEYAETLGMFLEFAKAGVNGTVPFMDDVWANAQNLFSTTAGWYVYTLNWPILECEMGNFAQIISEYRNFRGDIPYFDNVINDLQNKLLISGFNSPAWGTTGVLKHATGVSEQRLGETMGALTALQMLYPYFSPSMQANFRSMLDNGTAWQGLLDSNLYNKGQFRFFDDVGTAYSGEASSLGAMMLFLYGIIPDTGYLAINASDEVYNDYRTCFPTSEWSFNYQNQTIRIPVMAGNLSFIFGSEEISRNFPSNGVYDIQFSNNWNSIVLITQVAGISSVTLQPITLQTIPHSTANFNPNPIFNLNPSLSLIPTPKPTPAPVATPTPSPQSAGSTPTITPINPTTSATSNPILILTAGCIAIILLVFSLTLYEITKNRKKTKT
jgi:hypothetical protein